MSETVRFPTLGGHELAGLYLRTSPGAPAVAMCHGMLSSKESEKLEALATALASRGLASLRFDMSGRGESGGDPRRILYSQERADCAAAVAFLRGHGHARTGLFGSSMGGAVAVLCAADDPEIAAVVTLAAVARPALFLDEVPFQELARWRAQGWFEYDGVSISVEYIDEALRTDVLGAARRLGVPLLVLHGALDAVVPAEDGRLLAEAGRGELCLYAQADHRFSRPQDRAAALGRAVEFLARHLSGVRRQAGS
jgi:alpha-beta hydrolase superfamily lysophospholipase